MDLAKQDWLDALDDLIESEGADRVKEILSDLQLSAYRREFDYLFLRIRLM